MGKQEPAAKILVVDDSPTNLRLLERLLTHNEYQVTTARDGLLAMQKAHQDPPDMILLDIAMPDMDGYQVCQHLKTDEALREIPVIFISVLDELVDKVKAFKVGGVDYITKPIQDEDVLMRIKTHLTLSTMRKELAEKNAQLEEEIMLRQTTEQQLLRMATTDPLTELFNRSHFFDLAGRELSRSQRKNRPISFLLMDIDHFKKINDSYGHLVGDQTLIRLAEICQGYVRKYDILARYSGEEFIALLPETDLEHAKIIAERMRELVENSIMEFEGITFSITVSIGVATIDAENNLSLDGILDRVEKALYRAKRSGRNLVIG
jgi:diguanylate cyclase (GGDEF)-like protein